jgi:hypothetical protein
MDISGSLHANLRAALQSARRLREGPVHPDTVDHWTQLVAVAKDDESALETFSTRELMKDLEKVISARQASGK